MKILWITNKMPHAVALHLENANETPSGGWIDGLYSNLSKAEDIRFCFAFPHSERLDGETEAFSFHSFHYCPLCAVSADVVARIEDIIDQEKPDAIHIFGSEFTHAYAAAKAAEAKGMLDNTILNLQGIMAECAKHYTDCLPQKVIKRYTLKDIVSGNTIKNQQKDFEARAEWEEKLLGMVKHVIGRTDFDKSFALKANSKVNYYFCNETLREEFYSGEWSSDTCEKHSVFISQASYPIKGLHCFLPAAAMLKKKYPDLKVYIAGQNMKLSGIADRLRAGSYKLYLNQLISALRLKNTIVFLGLMRSRDMKKQYLNANVFVSPSVMENSSNSVCEAMLLGAPIVTSRVGGVETLLKDEEEGLLYECCRAEDLAECIERVFEDEKLAEKLSKNARARALKTHNIETNNSTMLAIYNSIIK